VGFEATANEVDLVSGQRRPVEIALSQLEDYHSQLSGTEWVSNARRNDKDYQHENRRENDTNNLDSRHGPPSHLERFQV
jgi:hypothetical protein